MTFSEAMETVARAFEVLGAAVLVVGVIFAAIISLRAWRKTRDGEHAYGMLRRTIGGVLLLGLEILVAADLVKTVSVEATLENVAVLGLIVVIRTVLSFSLEIEIEGVPPWRRAMVSGATHIAHAVRDSRAGPTPPAGG